MSLRPIPSSTVASPLRQESSRSLGRLIQGHLVLFLNFKWQESGGPAVAAPVRQGFGTQLLKTVFPNVKLEYAVKGLRYEIEASLVGHLSETQATTAGVNA